MWVLINKNYQSTKKFETNRSLEKPLVTNEEKVTITKVQIMLTEWHPFSCAFSNSPDEYNGIRI